METNVPGLFMKADYGSAKSTPATIATNIHLSTKSLQSDSRNPAIKMVLWLNKREAGYKKEADALV